jgi:hypothetical protein
MSQENSTSVFLDRKGTLTMHKDPGAMLSSLKNILENKGIKNVQFFILSSDSEETIEEYLNKNTNPELGLDLRSQISGYAGDTVFKKPLDSQGIKIPFGSDLTGPDYFNIANSPFVLIDDEPLSENPKHHRLGALKYEESFVLRGREKSVNSQEVFENLFFIHYTKTQSLLVNADHIAEKLIQVRDLYEEAPLQPPLKASTLLPPPPNERPAREIEKSLPKLSENKKGLILSNKTFF